MTKTQITKCLGCGRKLKAKASVAAQRGPRCRAKYEARVAEALASLDLSAYTGEQVVKAAELIAENAIVAATEPSAGIYWTVASDGLRRYTTWADRCTCKAGQYGRRCYHRAAALVLDTVSEVAA